MAVFIHTYNQPKLNHEEIQNPNRPIMNNTTESGTKDLLSMENSGTDNFLLYPFLKEKPILNLLKLLKMLSKREPFKTHFSVS